MCECDENCKCKQEENKEEVKTGGTIVDFLQQQFGNTLTVVANLDSTVRMLLKLVNIKPETREWITQIKNAENQETVDKLIQKWTDEENQKNSTNE